MEVLIHHLDGIQEVDKSCKVNSSVKNCSCNFCSRVTRFPHYNDPLKLVKTRGVVESELIASHCTVVLLAMTLVWSLILQTMFGHNVIQKPWEGGCILILVKQSMTDRYYMKRGFVSTNHYQRVLSGVCSHFNDQRISNFTSQILSVLEDRDKIEREALDKDLLSIDDALISLPGRQSGDKQWRIARSEFGTDSLSSSACEVRICRDEQVTKIYNAFSSILHKFVEESVIASKGVEVLKILRATVVDLKKLPYIKKESFFKVKLSCWHIFVTSIAAIL
ncbi:hypothetical protein F3Y22_tig00012370pilonHSYRG00089 [Hibiscus syriacus]|uniref:Uncharacterized protein n=1 Tax=Hibiscus syriacus TaxID=106335 RepID=A0A6A3C3Y1_HIBSY|nr:hypothetical protein F3Y22_tig00012370pilonHSYRG00089 [Hibiscus syriacus]